MQYSKGKCSKCGKETVIVNKTHGLCLYCNKARLAGQKDRYGGNNNDNNDNTPKQSQISLFKTIWEESNKKCQLTGEDLSWIIPMSKYWFSCFAHILAKGKYPKYKYNINNILLVHPEVHYQLDFGTKDSQLRRIGQGGMDKWEELKENLLYGYGG